MLSFTFDKDSYLGTYNGRFVFHAPDNNETLSDNYLRLIADGNPDALVKNVFRHEFFHWLAFRSSVFGIATIGRRYRTRTEFLLGNNSEVKSYYQQRTAYFCCSYNAHEQVVDQLDNDVSSRDTKALRNTKLMPDQVKQIKDADKLARKATIDLGSIPTNIYYAIDYIKGLRASAEFGLQVHIRTPNRETKLREVSLKSITSGILNAAFEEELGPKNQVIGYLKKLRRALNREKRIGGFNKNAMARWAVIKFTTEAETVRKLSTLGYPTPFDFEQYAQDISTFAHKHTLNTDKIMESNLASLIQSCLEYGGSKEEYVDLIYRFNYIDEPILYFFYVHGN